MAVEKEILVYHNIPFKKYRWISYISFVQIGFLAANLFAMPTVKAVKGRQDLIETRIKKKEETDLEMLERKASSSSVGASSATLEEPTSKKYTQLQSDLLENIFNINNLSVNVIERPFACAAIGSVSLLVITAAIYYARRMVHMITLLPNNRVRISVFSPFPFTRPPVIEVPLVDISCKAPRDSEHNYSILKIRNYSGYHLVHKREGEILEPKLYDEYLGYARSWAK